MDTMQRLLTCLGTSVKWLTNKGYGFRDAVDGQKGVEIFEKEGPFEYVMGLASIQVLILCMQRGFAGHVDACSGW